MRYYSILYLNETVSNGAVCSHLGLDWEDVPEGKKAVMGFLEKHIALTLAYNCVFS